MFTEFVYTCVCFFFVQQPNDDHTTILRLMAYECAYDS